MMCRLSTHFGFDAPLNLYGYIPRSLLRTLSCFAIDTPQLAAAQFIISY